MSVAWTASNGIALVVGLAILFVITFGSLFVLLGFFARRKEADARRSFPTARKIDRAANFFGQQSRGVMQVRGNGTLILTDTELIFQQWVPKKEFRIPLSRVRSLETPSSFLGKSRFTPLLKVVFSSDQGSEDAMAWQVRDLNDWMGQIQDAKK